MLSPKVIDLIDGDQSTWEQEPRKGLAERGELLRAFLHDGYWQPMDTLRDKNHLDELWQRGFALIHLVMESVYASTSAR